MQFSMMFTFKAQIHTHSDNKKHFGSYTSMHDNKMKAAMKMGI